MRFRLSLTALALVCTSQLPAFCGTGPYFLELNSIDSRILHAIDLTERSENSKFIRCASSAISSHSLNSKQLSYVYCLRGNALAMLGEYANAALDIETGMRLNPTMHGRAALYALLATCFAAVGNFSESLKNIEKSISLDPCTLAFKQKESILLQWQRYNETNNLSLQARSFHNSSNGTASGDTSSATERQ